MPYDTEAEALAEPAVQETYHLPRVDAGQMDQANRRRLLEACEQAGVELGAYDRSVLAWLAGWEPQVVQVVVGIIERAAGHGPGLHGPTLAAVSAVLGCKPEWLRHVVGDECTAEPELRCQIGVMWCCKDARAEIGWQPTDATSAPLPGPMTEQRGASRE